MPKRLIKKYLPDPEQIRNNRSLRWLGPRMQDPDLWHFNRQSVAGAVAVGAFFAFMLPVAQFLAAALLAIVLRVNLPVAMMSTLITNPFTFGPWYYLAYRIGATVLGADPEAGVPETAIPQTGTMFDGLMQGFDTLFSMGEPLLVGLSILAAVFSTAGYLLVHALWRAPAYLRLYRRRAGSSKQQ